MEKGVVLHQGCLRRCPDNPRYFMDGSGKAIYLTGSHTWETFQDRVPYRKEAKADALFDYEAYLAMMVRYHHNFLRMWCRGCGFFTKKAEDGSVQVEFCNEPCAYTDVNADGSLGNHPVYDLTSYNQAYFDRLRERVIQAGEKGIYVSVMLFDAWNVDTRISSPWGGHPYNKDNNINGIDGKREDTPEEAAQAAGGIRASDQNLEAGFLQDNEHIRIQTLELPEVIFPDAPYTTRLLIRRPARTEDFSGNVVIEVLNASAMMDIDRMWVNSWKYFTRNGDIYIGITSKGHVVDALKKFDPKRYKAINWSNPMPEREAPPQTGPFPFLSQYESGLFWNMLVDLAKLLRTDSKDNPIASFGKCYLYLTGWSQSGGYVTRIVNSFAYLPEHCEDSPLFDGYLAAGCGAEMAPMNAYEGGSRFGRGGIPKGSRMGAKEPYININTESENRHVSWIGDSDQPGYLFRTYQIPGSSHDSSYNLLQYYEGQGAEDNLRFGMVLRFNGESGEAMDYPYEPIFCAAFRNLYLWVREGIPAPHAPKIETEIVGPGESDDPFGTWVKNQTDAFGNAKGGIRFPAIDYPTARYQSYSRLAEGRVDAMFGTTYPLPAEVLCGLYGNLEQYRRLVEKSAWECVKKGFLLEEDLAECVEVWWRKRRKEDYKFFMLE